MIRYWIIRLCQSFSLSGLLVGTLFFAASLTPMLVPRAFFMQGALSGLSFAAGYGIGFFARWLWQFMELPEPKARMWTVKLVAAVICAAIAAVFLWKASAWQNSIRDLMGMEPVDTAHPLEVGLIALVTFAVLIAVARLFRLTFVVASEWLNRYVPRRVSYVIGTAISVTLFWSLIDGILLRYALHVMDSSFRNIDALVEPDTVRPADPNKTGSAASVIRWDELGRQGQSYIGSAPTAKDLQAFARKPAMDPLRVYVGLRSAETSEERAKLALEELKRIGAFERSLLVIITPTGTGWVDPELIDPLEYLHGGDVASVGVQYSYLASWLSLLVEPGYGADTSRDLFREVYGYWTTLPRDHRPQLYLAGLSLGALSSEQSSELFEVIGDPYQGALWSGPPFPSRIWNAITRDRNPGTPAWLPRFRDGSYVRFTSQKNALAIPGAHWGPMRIVYLQYASDAITFFEYSSFYREPDWMKQPRGPDVSPEVRWYPVITFLQLLLDVATATTTPMGYGHVYAASHYIDAWIAVTNVQGWTADDIARLKEHFDQRSR
jgi:uncharacterized membrane protein